MENPKFAVAMRIAKELDEKDFEENDNKILAYKISAGRYEFLAKLADAGVFSV